MGYQRHEHSVRGAAATGFLGCFGGTLGVFAAVALAAIGLVYYAFREDGPLDRRKSTVQENPAGSVVGAEPPTKTGQGAAAVPPLGKTSTIGNATVSINSVAISHVTLKGFGDREGKSDALQLIINTTTRNLSKTKKIDYSGWHDTFTSHGALSDALGNRYKWINFGFGATVVGQPGRGASIYPGDSLEDILVFETPVKAARSLILELDADRVGERGKFKLQFPAPAQQAKE